MAKISNYAFDALVADVMTAEPYASAQRVFWVVDNGTIHRGQKSIDRLQGAWPNLVLVHLPRHASWLNPIEIYFSIVQRKALTPCHFERLDDLAQRILGFQAQFAKTATPFDWTFTRRDLNALLDRLDQRAGSHRPPERAQEALLELAHVAPWDSKGTRMTSAQPSASRRSASTTPAVAS